MSDEFIKPAGMNQAPEEFLTPSVAVTPGDSNASAEIIAEIQAQQANILPNSDGTPGVPGATPTAQEPLMSEQECIATLHAIYQLIAFAMNTDAPSQETIELRGKQFFLISQRYGLNVKYMDLIFFGIGVSSDMILMYKNRKPKVEELQKQKEIAAMPPTEQERLLRLPEQLMDVKLPAEPMNAYGA